MDESQSLCLFVVEKATEPRTRRNTPYPEHFVLEATLGSLRLFIPTPLARKTYSIAVTLLILQLFGGSALIATLLGHDPFGFLPIQRLNPDPTAGLIASFQTVVAIILAFAFRRRWWAEWYPRFLKRHSERFVDLKVLGLITGKVKTTPTDYCVLRVEAEGEEFPLVIHQPLSGVEAALRLADQETPVTEASASAGATRGPTNAGSAVIEFCNKCNQRMVWMGRFDRWYCQYCKRFQ